MWDSVNRLRRSPEKSEYLESTLAGTGNKAADVSHAEEEQSSSERKGLREHMHGAD